MVKLEHRLQVGSKVFYSDSKTNFNDIDIMPFWKEIQILYSLFLILQFSWRKLFLIKFLI